jgi:hypothetical protein
VPDKQVLLEVVGADGLDSGSGEPGEQDVRVDGVRPALAALGEVVAQGDADFPQLRTRRSVLAFNPAEIVPAPLQGGLAPRRPRRS